MQKTYCVLCLGTVSNVLSVSEVSSIEWKMLTCL